MRLFVEITRSRRQGHHSGLNRVAARLLAELSRLHPGAVHPLVWNPWRQSFRLCDPASGRELGPVSPAATDWILCPEIFAPAEKPGITRALARHPWRRAALFYDLIPLTHPAITWPRSVRRHPAYLAMLREFDRLLAISQDSASALSNYARAQGWTGFPPLETFPLGADFLPQPRRLNPGPPAEPALVLSVGILEPRKNQAFLLRAATRLWKEGRSFELVLIGRVNPHFGRPIEREVQALAAEGYPLRHLPRADDPELARLFSQASFTVFPTIAEGAGLPVLESLWMGVPILASNLPSIRELAAEGGCLLLPPNDLDAWCQAFSHWLTRPASRLPFVQQATRRHLPTWADSAAALWTSLAEAPPSPTRANP